MTNLAEVILLIYGVIFGVIYGLGLPVAMVRHYLGKKTDCWPDTEDVLISMGLLLVCFVVWGAWSITAMP